MGNLARNPSALRATIAPHLVARSIPVVLVAAGIKLVLELLDVRVLDLNPLLSGLVGANVFLLGFLLAGTVADYKESERLPGEIASSLDTIADEALILHADQELPEAAACLDQLVAIGTRIQAWLLESRPVADVYAALRGLNPLFAVFGPAIQPGFTTRLKGEQAAIRKAVIRIDAIKTTSFVAAAYAIARLTGGLLVLGLLLTDLSSSVVESLFFVATITLLLSYVYLLIRDLDNPFAYPKGVEGAADVSLSPLKDVIARLDAERAALRRPEPVAA